MIWLTFSGRLGANLSKGHEVQTKHRVMTPHKTCEQLSRKRAGADTKLQERRLAYVDTAIKAAVDY